MLTYIYIMSNKRKVNYYGQMENPIKTKGYTYIKEKLITLTFFWPPIVQQHEHIVNYDSVIVNWDKDSTWS